MCIHESEPECDIRDTSEVSPPPLTPQSYFWTAGNNLSAEGAMSFAWPQHHTCQRRTLQSACVGNATFCVVVLVSALSCPKSVPDMEANEVGADATCRSHSRHFFVCIRHVSCVSSELSIAPA
eukprot:3880486-Rhodomonas_salina.1